MLQDLASCKLLHTRPGKLLHSELERSTMLCMGKSILSMSMFNSYMLKINGKIHYKWQFSIARC